MNNVTEINTQLTTHQILTLLNKSIRRGFDENNIDDLIEYISLDGLMYRETYNKYDLMKFFNSLTDEEVNWKKFVHIEGEVVEPFYVEPPEDIWDDKDALEKFRDNLSHCDVETEDRYFGSISLKTHYFPMIVPSPEVIAKLEDAKTQIKKYELEGSVYELVETGFSESVDATSLEDAKSKISFLLDDEYDCFQHCTFYDEPEVQWLDGEVVRW